MEDGAPGLSISEPGNMVAPLPSEERVAAVAGVGEGRLKTGRAIEFLPFVLFTQ